MNENNGIISYEMYEDLKETLVKAIKSVKTVKTDGSIHSNNAPTERIERLIEAAELSQGQIAQLLEQLRKRITLPGVQNGREQAMADKYNTLLTQLAGRLEVIDKENRQTRTLIEQVGQAVEAAAKPENLSVQEHHHAYTLDLKSSKTFLTMFVMLGGIFLQGAFIYRISENNRLLAVNDLKYRYVKMCGKIGEKELTELETVFWDEQYTAIRDTVRNRVERYEEAVRRRAERLEQAAIKEKKAKQLLEEAGKIRNGK